MTEPGVGGGPLCIDVCVGGCLVTAQQLARLFRSWGDVGPLVAKSRMRRESRDQVQARLPSGSVTRPREPRRRRGRARAGAG